MTLVGMALARVAQCGHGAYHAHIATRVGTSQDGEAMIFPSYFRRLAVQPGLYWLVPDSEAVVGALRTYQEGSTAEMACTTCMPRSWEAAAWPQPRPPTWSPCRRTGSWTLMFE